MMAGEGVGGGGTGGGGSTSARSQPRMSVALRAANEVSLRMDPIAPPATTPPYEASRYITVRRIGGI